LELQLLQSRVTHRQLWPPRETNVPTWKARQFALSKGGAHIAVTPQTFAVPAPPHVSGEVQLPQLGTVRIVPQLSFPVTLPQFFPFRAQNAAFDSAVQPKPRSSAHLIFEQVIPNAWHLPTEKLKHSS
jgi:hypothetical protein